MTKEQRRVAAVAASVSSSAFDRLGWERWNVAPGRDLLGFVDGPWTVTARPQRGRIVVELWRTKDRMGRLPRRLRATPRLAQVVTAREFIRETAAEFLAALVSIDHDPGGLDR